MAARSVDSLLLPGMMEMNVAEALNTLESLCGEMKESVIVCQSVAARLRFLHGFSDAIMAMKIPARYADALGGTVTFFKKYSCKGLLHRIAATRSILVGLCDIHQKSDVLFNELQLGNSSEMTAWKDSWDGDVHKQMEQFLNSIPSYQLTSDFNNLEEAVTLLKYELERKRNENSDEHINVIEAALAISGLPSVPDLPTYFILRDDVELQADPIGEGSIGVVYEGKWGARKQRVAVKRFLLDTDSVQADFLRETRIADTLDHPNVLKFHGACHVGNPVFTVCEYAGQGNFAAYFANPAHMSNFWQLFLEVGQGLLYLHQRSVVHGCIRCSNILAGSDGKAKISDAGYINIRRMSVGRSLKGGINSTRWMAPECLLEQGRAAEKSYASDIYSFGMTIIEAKTGKHPWPNQETDEDVIDALADEAVYEHPQQHFTPREWELVSAMCRYDPKQRMPLEEAIVSLTELANTRHYCQNPSCPLPGPDTTKFCGECGERLVLGVPPGFDYEDQALSQFETANQFPLSDSTVTHEDIAKEEVAVPKELASETQPTSVDSEVVRLQDYVRSISRLKQEEKQVLLDGIRTLEAALQRESAAKLVWEWHARECCKDCSSPIHQHDTVAGANSPQTELGEGISAGDAVGGDVCAEEIVKPRDAATSVSDDRAGLLSRIKELEKQLGIQNYPGYEELTGRFCNNCGDLNPITNIFCSECGNDIGVIRRNKL